jgi:hypothetical protein
VKRHRDAVNRTVLIVLGLVLLVGGAYALLRSYGAFGGGQADDRQVTDDVRAWFHRNADWFWPLMALVSALVAFAALRWLWMQRPDPMPSDDLVYGGEQGATVVHSAVLGDAVEDDLVHGPLVETARVGVQRTSGWTLLVTRLAVRDGTSVDTVADDIMGPAVQHCRDAIELDDVAARVVLDYADGGRSVR